MIASFKRLWRRWFPKETAVCTLCGQGAGFYDAGCMIRNGDATDSGWNCNGRGYLWR